ncbi:MAG TPA: family 1 glycosylhydrolase [Kofleriaceae bacterium]|nr:family 1 glycosylhydrolase [Kofleriaceae bacterium]
MMRSLLLLLLAAMVGCAFETGALDDTDDDAGGGKADGDSRSIAWSVSRHVFTTDSKAQISQDLALAAQLGVRYVRTDIWWFSIEPTRGHYDQAALDFYRWYVEEADHHGLSIVAIVSGAPDWARALYSSDRAAFVTAFGNYSEQVAKAVGDRVRIYQLWNEPNHINDFPDGDTDVALFRAAKDGLARGATIPFRTAINVLVDGHDGPFGHWEDDLRYYLDHGARSSIDIIAIDHYPGTWSVGDWGGNIVDRLFALGSEQGKSVAIFEAGYATSHCVLPLNTESGQVGWIHDQIPKMRSKILAGTGAPFVLVNWFKLDDRNTGNCFDPEDNFGIVHTDRTPKPAFAALAAEIAND